MQDGAGCLIIFLKVNRVFALINLDISTTFGGLLTIYVGILGALIAENYLTLLLEFV